ncbi:MAG: hypothetical protein FJX35_04025 [Alphaproteobacteria bacterium]|nr:hypothetical protein [Alphaproteobacteria bacterium]
MDRRSKTRRPYPIADPARTAEYWRNRAEEARMMAVEMAHFAPRETLLKIADGYDRLAEQAEKRSLRRSARPA